MSDFIERLRKCSERLSESKFPDYHASRWLERAADHIEELEAKIKRLTNRGIEDMKFCIEQQEDRIEDLEAALEKIRFMADVSGAHNTVMVCRLALKEAEAPLVRSKEELDAYIKRINK